MKKNNVIGLLVILAAVSRPIAVTAQTADCIAAEVNDQVITLSDLRIVRIFGLAAAEWDGKNPAAAEDLLSRMIDRKIVLELAQEKMPVDKKETEAFLDAAIRAMGRETMALRLKEFGLDEEDLRIYIEEKIRFDKIISMRFSQSVIISLKEIEEYYSGTYLPDRLKDGQTAKPMMQVVKDIEERIRADKIKAQVASWILSLKKQAEIRLDQDCLKNLKERMNES